jgi:hypothetical protein
MGNRFDSLLGRERHVINVQGKKSLNGDDAHEILQAHANILENIEMPKELRLSATIQDTTTGFWKVLLGAISNVLSERIQRGELTNGDAARIIRFGLLVGFEDLPQFAIDKARVLNSAAGFRPQGTFEGVEEKRANQIAEIDHRFGGIRLHYEGALSQVCAATPESPLNVVYVRSGDNAL